MQFVCDGIFVGSGIFKSTNPEARARAIVKATAYFHDPAKILYIPDTMRRFAAHEVIPFPSILVGSENDHYMTLDSARELAGYWNSRFFNAGAVGHINLDSGHGPWPQGETLLTDLIKAHVE
ncbi:MAG: hypothetical protein STSR0002_28020 [Smithella sp.]|jgi:predicted alpha/beta hydrolase family esterase